MLRAHASTAAIAPAAALICVAALGASVVATLATSPPPSVELAGYVTSLQGRTPGQRHNARLAAAAIDGKVIPRGGVLSFNGLVRSWSADQGYVKAPVSYDGELVRAFGGGVCQTSTTLYNAAILAGLGVVERHRHVYAPRYVPPGRDAAVAYPSIDLRLRNPYPWAVTIRAGVHGDLLEARVLGARKPEDEVEVRTEVIARLRPARRLWIVSGGADTGDTFGRCPGLPGYRVVTWRDRCRAGRPPSHERLSDDTYPAMDRIVQVSAEEPAQP